MVLGLVAGAQGCRQIVGLSGLEYDDAFCNSAETCDDANPCTEDACGNDQLCRYTANQDGLYPDGIHGNCKRIECTGGVASEVPFPDDVDDGDECTVDKCTESGATHDPKAGLVCHKAGGIGVCLADGSCSIECGGLDASGNEIGCQPSDDPCSLSYCDKAQGKCVIDVLDGVPQPGTEPGDCGGVYCVQGKSDEQFTPAGTACTGTTVAGNPAIVCDGAGKCVGCNTGSDCDPSGIGNSFCFTAMCVSTECSVTTAPDGIVLPAAQQVLGDCKQKQCSSFKVIEVPDDLDVNDDMNLCTTDTCMAGSPLHTPTALNSPCGASGTLFCDGAGTCQDCSVAAQCGSDTDCHQFACNNGTCADIFPVVNTPVSAAGQTAGDCLLQVCDGAGGIKANNDDNDTPNDNNDCTLDQCSNGSPVFPPVGVGSVCSQNRICDATGHCLGGSCSVQGDCPNGSFCVDSVCCNTACSTTCQTCTNTLKGSGLNGDCGTSAPGTDNNDTDCPGPKVCDGTTGAGACKLPVGQPCAMPSDCLLGFCVDGSCCNSACSGVCQWCNAPGSQGQCTNIPFGMDPANECAGAVNCNGTGSCGNLFGNGTACMLGTECSSSFCTDGVCCSAACGGTCQACNLGGNVGTCTNISTEQDPNNECAGTLVCNGAGLCKQPKGVACAVASDCASGFCADGVCCDSACGGACKACNLAGTVGTCSNVGAGQDPASECPGATNCNGNGACALFSNGTACTIGMECSSGNCIDGVCCNTTCVGACKACNVAGSNGTCTNIANGQDPASECTGAQVCNGAAACVGGPNGAVCGANSECASTFCIDGVCCNNVCNTICKACNIAGSVGTCSNTANGQDPANECPGVTNCNGAGACALLANGTACAIGGECSSGNCVDGVCCNAICAGTCQACNVPGNTGICSNIALNGTDNNPVGACVGVNSCDGMGGCKKNDGQVCAAPVECLHANCIDGYCCNTACGSLCMACNIAGSLGTCSNVPSGTDPANECAGVSNCNGSGACGLLALGSTCSIGGECTSGNCVDGVCCSTATCAGTCKSCNQAQTGGAAGFCANIASNSDPANECSGALSCDGNGACQLVQGASCSLGIQCGTGNCVDGVCCSTATCSGTCKSCNQAQTGGAAGVCNNITLNTDPANECSGALSCDGAGACQLALGASCTVGTQCGSGNCVDGVCCTTATCAGACKSCNQAQTGGAAGFCANIASNLDPANECAGALSCDGNGACQGPQGASCTLDTQCGTGHCVDNVCCGTATCGVCEACSAALNGATSGTCSLVSVDTDPHNDCTGAQVCNILGACVDGPNGGACFVGDGADNTCASSQCWDGFCCNVSCNGLCEACSAAKSGGPNGTCAPVPNNQDPDAECPGSQTCDGSGACQ